MSRLRRKKKPFIRTLAVRAGASYRYSGRKGSVIIEAIADSGVWAGTDVRTGREVYVTVRDLGEEIVSPPGSPVIDRKKLAASDLD